ncbi:MAG: NAD(+) synthase, partial [Proteobacteria bacterium]|nr:NAD(+) synthase [Pseudomonadota bacterium]
PTGADGRIVQLTEETIGPFALHDFFLNAFVGDGARPSRIFALAQIAFSGTYPPETIRKWLRVFIRRFFGAQWKRDATPDGPKVLSIALSPRGDWRMPSDAVANAWLADLDQAPILAL